MDWLRHFAACLLFTLLVILIFFMVVLPIRSDVPPFVDVPTARWATKSPEVEEDVTISIGSDGRIYLANSEVGAGSLEHRLSAARFRRGAPPTVRVRADRTAEFHRVRCVVRAARDAGFRRVTFMVRQENIASDAGFSLASAWPRPSPVPAALVAVGCLAGAVAVRFLRRSPSTGPGCAGWLLLLLAALAIVFIWSIYFPSCPPGMWC